MIVPFKKVRVGLLSLMGLSVASSLLVWGYSAVLAYLGQTTSLWATLGAGQVYALGWLLLGVGLWCLPVYVCLRQGGAPCNTEG